MYYSLPKTIQQGLSKAALVTGILRSFTHNCLSQCCGSGSVGSLSFRASRIRIRHYWYGRIFPYSSKKSKKNLDFYCFVTSDFLSTRTINVPSKSNNIKTYFLLASWKPLMKRAGSESGSQCQWYGSADPDLYSVPTRYGFTTLVVRVWFIEGQTL